MIRLAVRVRREQAELVLAELLELAPAGVEETALGQDTIEYAVYGAPGELPSLPDLKAAAGDALVEISTSDTADDWQDRWKRFHRPVLVRAPELNQLDEGRAIPSVYLRPPWENPLGSQDGPVEDIVIDPGQAFGTGGHASTRLCLQMLLELAVDQQRGPLLDVGTGSGVLAIAAARLGFSPVLGIDHERESIEAAGANARANDVQLTLRRLDLRSEPLPWHDCLPQASVGSVVVLANLLRPLLLALAEVMPQRPTQLIAGGLLAEQVDEIVHAYRQRLGMHEHKRSSSGEWAAVWLTAG